uniref:5'-nucleotidase n=1 Tax=Angiostrongylus cantonensis TaxID=6313 RepID=A0A0K0CVQ3_ANGCA
MSHVMGSRWRELFDVVIVDGNKPKWFLQDIPFKEIDITTGATSIGVHSGPLTKGEVYSGGCASEFKHRMNLHGKDILYVGDHIFGDVLKMTLTKLWVNSITIVTGDDLDIYLKENLFSFLRARESGNKYDGDRQGTNSFSDTLVF